MGRMEEKINLLQNVSEGIKTSLVELPHSVEKGQMEMQHSNEKIFDQVGEKIIFYSQI